VDFGSAVRDLLTPEIIQFYGRAQGRGDLCVLVVEDRCLKN